MDIEILHEDRLRHWCGRIGMPTGAVDALIMLIAEVQADPQLLALFERQHQKTAVRGEWHTDWSSLPFDALVIEKFGQRASLFYVLIYLAALPYTWQEYQRLGISAEVFDATLHDIAFYVAEASDVHGYWRFDQFMWVWRHLTTRLFRLGRLQYMLTPYEGHATAYRHKQTGQVVMLCGDGIPLRTDGAAMGAGIRPDQPAIEPPPAPAWVSHFKENAENWVGNSTSPYGYAQNMLVSLSKTDWDCILTAGDTVIDMHIPRGQDLKTEDLRASLRMGLDFFEQHCALHPPESWPQPPFRAFFCHTWFFTPQLQSILPPTSSIVRFQREFYLYPFAGGPGFLWSFVFGEKYPDPTTAPRDTSLRRAALDWLAAGKEFFDLPGVMFHSPEAWGSQPYMNAWDQTLK